MKKRTFLSALLVFLFLLIAYGSSSSFRCSMHTAVGKWRGGPSTLIPGVDISTSMQYMTLTVYKTCKASFTGMKCEWEAVDSSTITLECVDQGEPALLEFTAEGDRGSMEMGPMTINFDRE